MIISKLKFFCSSNDKMKKDEPKLREGTNTYIQAGTHIQDRKEPSLSNNNKTQ
jgi:hypothetical protein